MQTTGPPPKPKNSRQHTTGSEIVDALLNHPARSVAQHRAAAAKVLATAMTKFKHELARRGIDRQDLLD